MRLTAGKSKNGLFRLLRACTDYFLELITNSLSYLNPLKERELDLRGMPFTQTIS
jgi:hypothetical protein